jgi:sulfhydrogenase subunit beta (sulfur reductase)
MSVKTLEPAALGQWVDDLLQKGRFFAPQAHADKFDFAPLSRAEDLRLDYDVATTAPKKYFQPAREVLLTFDEKGCRSVLDREPFVLFGVHPYDMVAILQMDEVFSSDNCDVHYVERRKNATIVVSDVQNASPNVFAGCMGTATLQGGYDALVTKVGSQYVVEGKSPKGEALLEAISGAPDADEHSLRFREMVWEHNRQLLRRHELKVKPTDLPGLLEKSYEHPVWEERAKRCYSLLLLRLL